jgi:hypothetical protein
MTPMLNFNSSWIEASTVGRLENLKGSMHTGGDKRSSFCDQGWPRSQQVPPGKPPPTPQQTEETTALWRGSPS